MRHWEASERLPGRQKVEPFQQRSNPSGHRATDSRRWANATAPYEAVYEETYEPWGIMHR